MRPARPLICLALLLLTATVALTAAAPATVTNPVASASPDLVILIGDLPGRLARLEKTAKEVQDQPTPLLDVLKQWLGGMEWIDPARPIVLAVGRLKEKGPAAVLVPYRQANDAFRSQHNALIEEQAYLVRLDEGSAVDLPPALRQGLLEASRKAPERLLTVELAMASLLQREGASIGEAVAGSQPDGPEVDPQRPSPAELQRMIGGALEVAQQAERLTLGLDLGETDLATLIKVKATGQSPLASLLVDGGPTTLVSGYAPQGQVRFRARNYNLSGLVNLLDQGFGQVYRHLGIDFKQLASLGEHLTGEMAGAMAFGKTEAKLEFMAVLKNETAGEGFLEATYLPWWQGYGQSMAKLLEQAGVASKAALVSRTADSSVAGRKVVGVTARLPLSITPAAKEKKAAAELVSYPMRMAVVNNLLLTAPNDARLAELIKAAGALKPAPAQGPLMSWEADLTPYLGNLLAMLPEAKNRKIKVPPMGQATSQLDFQTGEAIASTKLKIADAKAIFQLFAKLAPAPEKPGKAAAVPPKPAAKKEPATLSAAGSAPQPQPTPSAASAPQPARPGNYWYTRGALASTYGNETAAVRCFRRVLKQEPKNAHAQFQLGVSLSQLGEYPAALQAMDEALRLQPDKGLFFYGRGRTYLMSGESAKADADFKKAADLDDPQAIDYLNAQRK